MICRFFVLIKHWLTRRKQIKSFVNFFKSCPVQSETLVARRNERNTLSVKAHF